jgi:hypothetical protein
MRSCRAITGTVAAATHRQTLQQPAGQSKTPACASSSPVTASEVSIRIMHARNNLKQTPRRAPSFNDAVVMPMGIGERLLFLPIYAARKARLRVAVSKTVMKDANWFPGSNCGRVEKTRAAADSL